MLSFYYSQKLLNLSGVLIKDIIHTENKTIFEIEMQRKLHTCPCCGHSTQRIHDYRRQKSKIFLPLVLIHSFFLEKEDMFVNLVVSISIKALTFFLAIIA